MISSIMRPVPVGTVLLVTTTLKPFRCWPIDRATSLMKVRSAEPSGRGGVPTAMNTACDASIAGPRSVVNDSRPSDMFLATRVLSPGS